MRNEEETRKQNHQCVGATRAGVFRNDLRYQCSFWRSYDRCRCDSEGCPREVRQRMGKGWCSCEAVETASRKSNRRENEKDEGLSYWPFLKGAKVNLKIYRGSELQHNQSQNRWLIHSVLPASSCIFILAEPKTGKSFVALDLALSVISGKSCFNQMPTLQTGPVAFYGAEDAPWIISERLEGIARAKGVTKSELEKLYVFDRSNGIFLDDEDSFQRFRSALSDIKPKLVILDPLAQLLFKTQESNARQMADVLRKIRQLQMELDCTVLITHHVRKGGKGSINERSRGSSMVASFWDGCLLMEKSFNGVVRIESSWKGFPVSPESFIRLQNFNGGFAPVALGAEERTA